MKISILFCFITTLLYSQQILDDFPTNQPRYAGGNIQFYKDFKKVLTDKNLKPCLNKEENINFGLVIFPDKSIKFVKPETADYEENKCSFDLTKEVLKYLEGWIPAEVDGKTVAAKTYFTIIPEDLFSDLEEGYDPINDIELATYDGGMNEFRKKVINNINISKFNFTGTLRLEVKFVIEKDGSVSNIELENSSGLKDFDRMIIRGVSSVRSKWSPAKIRGKAIRFRFRLPLTFSMQ